VPSGHPAGEPGSTSRRPARRRSRRPRPRRDPPEVGLDDRASPWISRASLGDLEAVVEHVIRSEMPMTTRISCSISRSRCQLAAQAPDELGHGEGLDRFMPAVGSSRSRSRGRLASARATSRRRWSPYGSLPASMSPWPRRPTKLSSRRASSWRGPPRRACAGCRGRRRSSSSGGAGAPDEDVLQGGHRREQPHVLVRAAMPRWEICPAEVLDRPALEVDPALVDVEEAGDAVEERRLPGPVGPDHAGDRAASIEKSSSRTATRPPNAW